MQVIAKENLFKDIICILPQAIVKIKDAILEEVYEDSTLRYIRVKCTSEETKNVFRPMPNIPCFLAHKKLVVFAKYSGVELGLDKYFFVLEYANDDTKAGTD